MIVYHGGTEIIENPDVKFSKNIKVDKFIHF